MNTTMTHWTEALVKLNACTEAVDWCRTQPDLSTAWSRCERGDWMLWLAGRLSGPSGRTPERLRLAACARQCAREAWPYVEDGATATAVVFCDHILGEWLEDRADLEDVRAAASAAAYAAASASSGASRRSAVAAAAYAAYAAYAAADAAAYAYADAAADAYAAYAAYAAAYAAADDAAYAYAAYAAYAAAYAAADAAAYAAAYAAADDAAYAAKRRVLRRCADIVRRHYPDAPGLPAIGGVK